ncbi:hypothetical protein RCO28_30915 [Streptomyces sp. LHD-70]|uniref:hypothetical protein n=1 Tax=Streptomyces sp. LHD-70 TaxID=3072140 RepID=UPI00280CFE0C|nr:hypothetical protein [Streptomyces sp. LHD-70]MDQ8706849.1 hypothetical protein [Streptomyces sp. LHD-70]
MDQGIAAVLGAGVGIAGGLGSALLGHMTARRQSRDQGRLDHGLKLRDERMSAYLAFLEGAERTLLPLADLRECLLEPDEFSEPAWLRIEQHIDGLNAHRGELVRLLTRVTLAGPQEVDRSAGQVLAALAVIARYIEPLRGAPGLDARTQPRFDELMHEVNAKHQSFVTAVRAVLSAPPL